MCLITVYYNVVAAFHLKQTLTTSWTMQVVCCWFTGFDQLTIFADQNKHRNSKTHLVSVCDCSGLTRIISLSQLAGWPSHHAPKPAWPPHIYRHHNLLVDKTLGLKTSLTLSYDEPVTGLLLVKEFNNNLTVYQLTSNYISKHTWLVCAQLLAIFDWLYHHYHDWLADH